MAFIIHTCTVFRKPTDPLALKILEDENLEVIPEEAVDGEVAEESLASSAWPSPHGIVTGPADKVCVQYLFCSC